MIWTDELNRLFRPAEWVGKKIMDRTPEWYLARRGRCTASKRAEQIHNGKAGVWQTMRREIEAELSDGYERDSFSNIYMEWGNKHEDQALANIELDLGTEADHPGLQFHPRYVCAAATPDFFIDSDISGQIKCPYYEKNHLKFIYDQTLPSQYYYQVQWEAWVSQRKKIIFGSYDPRQPLSTRLALIHLDANMEVWDKFESNLERFRKMMDGGSSPGDVKLIATVGIPELF